MATSHEDAGLQGEAGENRRTPEQKRDIGQPTLGQSMQEHLPPSAAPTKGKWPHPAMPGDHRPDPDTDKPKDPPMPEPKNDSGTVQRGGLEGERGQDDSVKSGDGVLG